MSKFYQWIRDDVVGQNNPDVRNVVHGDDEEINKNEKAEEKKQ